MLLFGLRLGTNPKTMIATTPRPTKLISVCLPIPRLRSCVAPRTRTETISLDVFR